MTDTRERVRCEMCNVQIIIALDSSASFDNCQRCCGHTSIDVRALQLERLNEDIASFDRDLTKIFPEGHPLRHYRPDADAV